MVKVKRVLGRVKDRRLRGHLETTLGLAKKVAAQSEERLDGGKPTDRVVSLVDPGVRPIVKGKLDKPVEFGRTGQITQDESGYFTQFGVHNGKRHLPIYVTENMVGHKLGEFAPTRTFKGHSGTKVEKATKVAAAPPAK